MQLKKILVPCDLKESSFNALYHAAHLAKQSGAEILLLHLEFADKALEASQKALEAWVDRMKEFHQGPVSAHVRKGGVVGEIPAFAKEQGCGLIVMPTHGMRGMQKLTGSLALRVVSESHIPFIIVQERNIRDHGYKKLVIPVDYRHQLLDESKAFVQLAQLFKSEAHLVIKKVNAELTDAKMLGEIQQAFADAGVSITLHEVDHKLHFTKELVRYAAAVEADLICAVNFSYEYLYTLFPRTEEEDLIYNDAQIPVLLITPTNQDEVIYNIPMRF
ncbi:MAG: universal stress protein [Flavobacteriales bacterium]|jgi:nucleotide-binding universal stress UspA family protein